MIEKEKYSSIRNRLRSLPTVQSSKDFEARLFRRINEVKHRGHIELERKPRFGFTGILDFLKQPFFAPAIALTSLVFVGLIIYLAFFTERPKENVTEQPAPPEREYSVSQLETLKTKVGNLKAAERERDISKREEISESRILSEERREAPAVFAPEKSTMTDERTLSTEEGEIPMEKLGGPAIEKKEAPLMEKSEKRSEDKEVEGLMKNAAPTTGESEKVDAKNDSQQDTTGAKDTAKQKKSRKKKSQESPQNPPVEQK
jgi:hypothetical protein